MLEKLQMLRAVMTVMHGGFNPYAFYGRIHFRPKSLEQGYHFLGYLGMLLSEDFSDKDYYGFIYDLDHKTDPLINDIFDSLDWNLIAALIAAGPH